MGEVLRIIKDDQWHTNREVREETGFSKKQLESVLKFFQDANVASVDPIGEKIRIKPFGHEIEKLPKD